MNEKAITVQQMKDILNQLDDNCKLIVNMVGNISVSNEDGYIGFIDFLNAKLELDNS
jgi:hypothetical protein